MEQKYYKYIRHEFKVVDDYYFTRKVFEEAKPDWEKRFSLEPWYMWQEVRFKGKSYYYSKFRGRSWILQNQRGFLPCLYTRKSIGVSPYTFRRGPVPGIHKSTTRPFRKVKHSKHLQENPRENEDVWDIAYEQYRSRKDKSWKNQKKKRQWM